MTVVSSPFVLWLRHAGVPLARPCILLLTLMGLLVSTLVYLVFILADDTPLRYLQGVTPEGRAMVRQSGIHQGISLALMLLGGLYCLARGWRFSRRLWLLLLTIVTLADLWRVMPMAVPLIVSLVLEKPLSEIPLREWAPLLPYLLLAGSFLILSFSLFSPSVNRWRRTMRALANTPR